MKHSPPTPNPHPESLRVDLDLANRLIVITPHGLQVLVTSLDQLHSMLLTARKPKMVDAVSSETMKLILADWVREGPVGAGKHHAPRDPVTGLLLKPKVRKFQANGKPTLPTLEELGLL